MQFFVLVPHYIFKLAPQVMGLPLGPSNHQISKFSFLHNSGVLNYNFKKLQGI